MCGRYYTTIEREELEEIIRMVNRNLNTNISPPESKTGMIVPKDVSPVFVLGKNGKPLLQLMYFGFKGFKNHENADGGYQPLYNARYETISEKGSFSPYLMNRCLVPVSAWVEDMKIGNTKYPQRIWSPDHPRLFLPAIYKCEPERKLPAFTIITKNAAESIRRVHNRMPIVPTIKNLREEWLKGGAEPYDLATLSETEFEYTAAQL